MSIAYSITRARKPVVQKTGQVASGGGGGGSLAWHSDWQGITPPSTTDGNVQDGTKWTNFSGPGNWLQVTSASGLGAPAGMDNVLRVELGASTVSRMITHEGTPSWSSIADGASIWYRHYMRFDFSNGFDTQSMHHIQVDGHGDLNYEFKCLNISGGQVQYRLHIIPLINANFAYDISNTGSAIFAVNTFYRIEWQLTRSGSNLKIPMLNVYNSSNALIATRADFLNASNGHTLTADDPDIPFTDNTVQDMWCGNNGPNLGSRDHSEYYYFAGWATSLTGACGAWQAGVG